MNENKLKKYMDKIKTNRLQSEFKTLKVASAILINMRYRYHQIIFENYNNEPFYFLQLIFLKKLI